MEPNPDLVMMLQNATLFASKWRVPFRDTNTAARDFHMTDGTAVSTDFLNGSFGAQYANLDGWEMLRLPYGDEGDLVAQFVLPPEGTAVSEVTSGLLATMEMSLEPTQVTVSAPKLDIASTASLVDALKQQGLSAVFSAPPSALGYIAADYDLFVAAIIQQGRFKMDEDGTIAAAVTEALVEAGSAPVEDPASFVADRPYLVSIQDTSIGWDLFQVMVNDPRP